MSATIHQFPAGGRAASPQRDSKATPPQRAATPSVSPAVTACGAAWYHEEAMREEERSRQR